GLPGGRQRFGHPRPRPARRGRTLRGGRRRRKVEFNRPKGGRIHCKVSCCVSTIMLNKSILLAKKEAVIIMLRLSIICCQGPSDVRRPDHPARCFHAAAGGFPRVFRGSARWSNRLHGAP